MKITARCTHSFVELKVDEIEATVWKSEPQEIEDVVENLIDVANELSKYTGKDFSVFTRHLTNEE